MTDLAQGVMYAALLGGCSVALAGIWCEPRSSVRSVRILQVVAFHSVVFATVSVLVMLCAT